MSAHRHSASGVGCGGGITTAAHRECIAALLAGVGGVEEVDAADALGRVPARDVVAPHDSPRRDDSAMDGYAVPAGLLGRPGARARVAGMIPAGTDPAGVLPEGLPPDAVAAVMTGAPVPAGTRAVVPVERTRPGDFDAAEITLPEVRDGDFVRRAGADLAAGTPLPVAGREVDALTLAALISQDPLRVTVHRRPRVLIVTGGEEVSAPGREAGPAGVPDSNGPMLAALCRARGMLPAGRLRTGDDVDGLRRSLDAALAGRRPDMVITSGGISHGRFEVVRRLLEADGEDAWFGHVAQQPGGPQGHARYRGVPVACLPGNPISTLVSFRMILAPAVPGAPVPDAVRAVLEEPVAGLPADDGRVRYRRAVHRVDDSGRVRVRPLPGAGSHMLASALGATCLLEVPAGTSPGEGDTVTLHPL